LRHIQEIKGGYPENFPGPFAVTPGNDRGMKIDKVSFLEEGMNGPAHGISDPGHGPEGVGPRPKVGNGPQKLKGVAFLLQWIEVRIRPTQHFQLLGLKFHFLAFSLRFRQNPLNPYRAARLQPKNLVFIVGEFFIRYNLKVVETGAVIQFNERKPSL
jgi:hypothetical protein